MSTAGTDPDRRPLSQRAHEVAVQMHELGGGPRPELEHFAHLDVTATAQAQEQQQTPGADPGPGWDMGAFDALPEEVRAGIQAGTAHGLGRGMLELEAERELVRPADVHVHLTDAARYVDGEGRVDRDAIRGDLRRLTTERPELSRYGHGPGQVGVRPDDRRHAAPGTPIGGHAPPLTDGVAHYRDLMDPMSDKNWRND